MENHTKKMDGLGVALFYPYSYQVTVGDSQINISHLFPSFLKVQMFHMYVDVI